MLFSFFIHYTYHLHGIESFHLFYAILGLSPTSSSHPCLRSTLFIPSKPSIHPTSLIHNHSSYIHTFSFSSPPFLNLCLSRENKHYMKYIQSLNNAHTVFFFYLIFILNIILYVQEVLTNFIRKLLYKLG